MKPVEVVYKSDAERGAVWHAVFAAEAPELRLVDWSPQAAAAARYLVAWTPPADLARAMPGLAAYFNIGAGIDHLPMAEIGETVSIVRMIDPELTRSMVEYVMLAVLAQHRDLPAYLEAQRGGRWAALPVRRAADHPVGILGLGVLGQAVAKALISLGFPVRGWSASAKRVDGVESFAGREALPAFLGATRSLVCLLPLTEDTRGILDAALFAALPQGAGLVNVGRGGHLVEADLVAALDSAPRSCPARSTRSPFGHRAMDSGDDSGRDYSVVAERLRARHRLRPAGVAQAPAPCGRHADNAWHRGHPRRRGDG